jgi:hypothetical protein
VPCTSGCTTTPPLMPERQPLTSLAEAALRSLALRADDHRRLAAAGSASPRGRHRPGHGDPLNGNAITDYVWWQSRSPCHDLAGVSVLAGASSWRGTAPDRADPGRR